jgi:dihydroorotase
MQNYVIKNVTIVNEGQRFVSDIWFKEGYIRKIAPVIDSPLGAIEIDGTNKVLLPGVIDDQVHFRQPGLTHKAIIYTEAKACAAGGITSFMEMPNTVPPALSLKLLEEKYYTAAVTSLVNYSFYMGVSNDNAAEVMRSNAFKKEICGIKIFMGSSTGNLLVDNYITLGKIFGEAEMLIATHCEDERVALANLERIKAERNGVLTPECHALIKDEICCFESSFSAVQLAKQHGTRLHILHISTAKELQLFTNMLPLSEKRITAEACVHHLHFTADDYATLGNRIKCNPSIKAANNKEAIWEAVRNNTIDVIATDHAPHLLHEKGFERKPDGQLVALEGEAGSYEKAHAGLPLAQHSLLLMLNAEKEGRISLEHIAQKMSHDVATCFSIHKRGFIREGFYADLVLVDLNKPTMVQAKGLHYKCKWSPLEGVSLPTTVDYTFVNGNMVYGNGKFNESINGMRLKFER